MVRRITHSVLWFEPSLDCLITYQPMHPAGFILLGLLRHELYIKKKRATLGVCLMQDCKSTNPVFDIVTNIQ